MKPYVRRTLPRERKIFSEPMTAAALSFGIVDGALESSLKAVLADNPENREA